MSYANKRVKPVCGYCDAIAHTIIRDARNRPVWVCETHKESHE